MNKCNTCIHNLSLPTQLCNDCGSGYIHYTPTGESLLHERVVSLQPKSVDVQQQIVKDGIKAFNGKIDAVVKETMEDNGFMIYDAEDLKQNGRLEFYPNGTSVFSYKGKPLLEFSQFETVFEDNKATLTQKYRRLSN